MSVDVIKPSGGHIVIGWGMDNCPVVKLVKDGDAIGVQVNQAPGFNPDWSVARLVTEADLILAINELRALQ